MRESFEKHLSAGKAHQDVGAVGRHTLIIIGWTICGGQLGLTREEDVITQVFGGIAGVPAGCLRRLEAQR